MGPPLDAHHHVWYHLDSGRFVCRRQRQRFPGQIRHSRSNWLSPRHWRRAPQTRHVLLRKTQSRKSQRRAQIACQTLWRISQTHQETRTQVPRLWVLYGLGRRRSPGPPRQGSIQRHVQRLDSRLLEQVRAARSAEPGAQRQVQFTVRLQAGEKDLEKARVALVGTLVGSARRKDGRKAKEKGCQAGERSATKEAGCDRWW
mmetsp:Transcript_10184/g.22436  ORF Transcript_10184/g.22436 Transcript_10184/m.22436 type:complete len:201 (-) Transcript_10184:213-815(-)